VDACYGCGGVRRTLFADPATDDAAQVLAGVAGTPCRPDAVVTLRLMPSPDTVRLSLVAGPAAGSSTVPPPTRDQALEFTPPGVAGTYDYRLYATWSGGRDATYFFRLKVG